MRFRHNFIAVGGLLAILLLVISDPNLGLIQNLPIGSGTIATLIFLFKCILYVGFLHVARKALIDYPEANFQLLGSESLKEPQAAAMFAIAISVMTLAIAVVTVGALAYG